MEDQPVTKVAALTAALNILATKLAMLTTTTIAPLNALTTKLTMLTTQMDNNNNNNRKKTEQGMWTN
jgi:hypothetical protein